MARLRYLQPVVDVLAPAIVRAPATLAGCSDDEVAALEALVAPHRLPAAYREFLVFGGKRLAGVFGGVDFSYRHALIHRTHANRDVLRMLRVADKQAVMPDTLFVLNEHLGSNFTYVHLDAGDEPPVYFREEGNGGLATAIREHDSFSAFVLVQASITMRLARRR